MTHWHSSETAPARDAIYLGVNEKTRIALYTFDNVFGWLKVADRGVIRCTPPDYWCEIPRFDGATK
jgi:hypothetical protein